MNVLSGWRQMTLAQKIGCVISLVLAVSYPLIVVIDFLILRK